MGTLTAVIAAAVPVHGAAAHRAEGDLISAARRQLPRAAFFSCIQMRYGRLWFSAPL